jgi:hypothetical protein
MRLFITFLVMLMISVAAFSTTIYEIQYTTVPGTGNNYPSLLVGQAVSTEGIVTGVGYIGGKYVISEAAGAWKSVFVNDPAHTPQLGDRVALTGTVNEVSGFTEIGSVTAYSVVSSGNDLPAHTNITPGNIQYNTGEAYEGVLVRLSNVRVSIMPFGNNFTVTDNSYSCQISNGFFPQPHTWSGIVLGQIWSEIYGIVYFSSGQYRVNPRNDADMIPLADINTVSLKLESVEAEKGKSVPVNVTVSKLEESWNIRKYSLKVGFNKRILSFEDVSIENTLSDVLPEITLSALEDSVLITYESDSAIVSPTNNGILLKLIFRTLSYGESVLDLTHASLNDTISINLLTDGKITIPIQKKIAWLNIYNDNYNKKNIFNPWLNQKITIEYGCLVQTGVASSKAIIRIYDPQGRLVATPVNKIIESANGIEFYSWDGRDRNKNLLPIGLYYCHVEIIDRVTGNAETTVQPIVVAAELK